MSEKLLAEVTADYVLKNRESGWLTCFAGSRIGAVPDWRRVLLAELCVDVRERVAERLTDHCVELRHGADSWWFWLAVTQSGWGELGVGLRNWKEGASGKADGSGVTIGVYNDSEHALGDAASLRIRDALGKHAFPRTKEPKWIGNIWLDQWNWKDVGFLIRVAEEREAVVGEVAATCSESSN